VTVGEWLKLAEARLNAAGIESGRTESHTLAAHILGVDRAWLLAHPEAEFPDLAGEKLLERRESREPLAYLLGKREFYGRDFLVRPGVLIPRHETETLVEAALADLPQGASVLDLGTGSGCIGITLKLERPDLNVTLSDVSEVALRVAAHNADLLGANVRLVRSDGFAELLGEAFDRVVSNPPYIGEGEHLMPEVADHEPAEALYSGPTGLEFYERLAAEGASYLLDGGQILLEVGYQQAGAVRELFEAQGWRHLKTIKDLSGVERVVAFQVVHECLARG
jgi:release factor glutamine methyltransferase